MKKILFLLTILVFNNCTDVEKSKFIKEDSGIFIEDIQDSSFEGNPYNEDNVIYTYGKEFIYDYKFIDKHGVEYLIYGYGTKLISKDSIHPYTVKEVSILPIKGYDANNYPETLFEANYILYNGEYKSPPSQTGVIENEKNVWIHPFRERGYFALLQLNPYPFIQQPFEIGNQWEWELEIGGGKYQEWFEGYKMINSQQKYTLVAIENIETNFGLLECYVVDAIGINPVKETKARFYFNKEYGFVQLAYDNIDGSKLSLVLKELKNNIK